MNTVLILIALLLVLVVLYLDLLAWRALAGDETLTPAQRGLQALAVLVVPLVGALAVLRLCELAHPGTVAPAAVPWPFRAIVTDRPMARNTLGESWEAFKRRHWNL